MISGIGMSTMAQNSGTPISLPGQACDCHAHVFGPYSRFPLATERPYDPPVAAKESYLTMLDNAGFARGVLVHGGANGWDHSAMLDALRTAPSRLRGIAVPPPNVTDEQLANMNAAGVRGVRFTQVAGPSAARTYDGRLDLAELPNFAPRLRELGWHAQLWANCDVIESNAAMLRSCGVPIVIDHLGYFDVSRGVTDSAFQVLAQLLADGYVWTKLTAFRNSKGLAPYADVQPFHDTLVTANPEQVVWGSDWPFLGMKGEKLPTVPALLQILFQWLPDPALREQVLSRNPARLYGFP
jgi:predicted TIM-barrel fold metal-dependent hydrolase